VVPALRLTQTYKSDSVRSRRGMVRKKADSSLRRRTRLVSMDFGELWGFVVDANQATTCSFVQFRTVLSLY
jgi:hypothetical protein